MHYKYRIFFFGNVKKFKILGWVTYYQSRGKPETKGIRNPISLNPDNPIKGIRYLVQNRTRSQWLRG